MEWLSVTAPDGRAIEVLLDGTEAAGTLVAHSGTPSAARAYPPSVRAAAARGLRLVSYSRPGYAGSSPQPGRTVADAARDVEIILDALGVDEFITAGWSGGGPHALACAALLPGRCRAAASIAGVAPYPADGLDWLAGMGPENVEEFERTMKGEAELVPFLVAEAQHLADVRPEQVIEAFGGLVDDADKRVLTGDFAEWIAETFRRSVSAGIAGWRDDDLALAKPWGFELGAIQTPVALWQGGQDRMVPLAHGAWLSSQMPSARVHLLPEEGHLSLTVSKFDEILDELTSMAGQQPGRSTDGDV